MLVKMERVATTLHSVSITPPLLRLHIARRCCPPRPLFHAKHPLGRSLRRLPHSGQHSSSSLVGPNPTSKTTMAAASLWSPIQSPVTRRTHRLRHPGESETTSGSLTVSRVRASPHLMPLAAKPPAVASESQPSLAQVWRELQGCNGWDDLVEPLRPFLRDEIVRYGELVGACYKAFDLDPTSKRYLNCKYGRGNMMREVGLGASGYDVTRYIYATPGVSVPLRRRACRSRWMGYVGVASDDEALRLGRRDVVVSFRGTVTGAEWVANFMSFLSPARLDPNNPLPDVKAERGFLSMYTSDDGVDQFSHGSCREQLLSELSQILHKYKGEEMSITFAGHSMGSAMATLAVYDLAELGLNRDRHGREIPITVYSFGGPRVGNSGFKERCEELGVRVLRVVNVNDPITKLPGVFLNENLVRALGGKHGLPWSCSCYAHVGVEVALNFFRVQDPAGVHDLEAYIRLLKSPHEVQVQKGEKYLLGNIGKLWVSKGFDKLVWQDAAMSVGNLVQSLGF